MQSFPLRIYAHSQALRRLIKPSSRLKKICPVLYFSDPQISYTRDYSKDTGGSSQEENSKTEADNDTSSNTGERVNVKELLQGAQEMEMPRHPHKCSDYDKFCLVYLGKYPSMAETPDFVKVNQIRLAQDLMRVRFNIILMIMFCTYCFGVAFYFSRQHHKKLKEFRDGNNTQIIYYKKVQD
ncbi:unnamed protein product [Mytilus edulis]|uniref:Uncharacterized protein n=1 Tax=Mytilus edulis TaxID=6550 RepID=A0A8S3UKT8_MYTED|nr:unnamed protein product [Mytilus edulis]